MKPAGASLSRSALASVRNPLLALPAVKKAARELDSGTLEALRTILLEVSADARVRAQSSWRSHKVVPAMYWKIIAVYSRHLAHALRKLQRDPFEMTK